jgi:hypothetical protein
MKNEGFFAPAGADGPKFSLPARWSIRVQSLGDQPVLLKVAIGFDENLEMVEASTPFQFDFVASRYTALVAASADGRFSAEVWSDIYGEFSQNGGFTGTRGKLLFQPSGPIYSSAGNAF